jgi:hypothetical protein
MAASAVNPFESAAGALQGLVHILKGCAIGPLMINPQPTRVANILRPFMTLIPTSSIWFQIARPSYNTNRRVRYLVSGAFGRFGDFHLFELFGGFGVSHHVELFGGFGVSGGLHDSDDE